MKFKNKFLSSLTAVTAVGIALLFPFGNSSAKSSVVKAAVTTPPSGSFTATGVQTDGYVRVNMPNHPNEWMITHQFKDQYGNFAYCMDSELPNPATDNAGKLNIKGAGSNEYYRMFKGGFPAKTASQLGAGNNTEAWYATQLVSWVLGGNFTDTQIVWSHPNHSAAESARVKTAFYKIYNYVKNGKETPNTEFTISHVKSFDKGGYHNLEFEAKSNKTGKTTLVFSGAKPSGMRILDSNGKIVANNQVNVNGKFTIQVPVTTPAGSITLKGTANVSTTNPFVYDGKGTFQDVITLITTTEKKDSKSVTANWASAVGSIKISKQDLDTNSKKLAGAQFSVYKTKTDATNGVNAVKTVTTDKDGNGVFTGLTLVDSTKGTYFLKETKAPSGYQLDSTVYEVKAVEEVDGVKVKNVNDEQKITIPATGSKKNASFASVGILSTLGLVLVGFGNSKIRREAH